MKKILFTLLFITLNIISFAQAKVTSVIEMSTDPQSPRFILYLNDKLNVQSTRIENATMKQMFGVDSNKIMKTIDEIYFVTYDEYYKLWIPEINTIFEVKSMSKTKYLIGEHLVFFVGLIRDNRNKKANIVNCKY